MQMITAVTITSRLNEQIRVQNVWAKADGFTEGVGYGSGFILYSTVI
jgi:hypothetical protein